MITETINYDGLASKWQIETKFGPTHRIKKKILKRILSSAKDKTICDIGCGCGIFSGLLQSKNSVYSLDLSLKALQFANKNIDKINPICANADALPFKDNLFDIILLLDILEHMKDDKQTIKEAGRVLKRGGLIVFSVPEDQRLFSRIDIRNGHYRRYSRQDLLRKFSLDLYWIRLFSSIGFPIMRLYIKLISKYQNENFTFSKINHNIMKIFSNLLFWAFHIDFFFQGNQPGVLLYGSLEKK